MTVKLPRSTVKAILTSKTELRATPEAIEKFDKILLDFGFKKAEKIAEITRNRNRKTISDDDVDSCNTDSE